MHSVPQHLQLREVTVQIHDQKEMAQAAGPQNQRHQPISYITKTEYQKYIAKIAKLCSVAKRIQASELQNEADELYWSSKSEDPKQTVSLLLLLLKLVVGEETDLGTSNTCMRRTVSTTICGNKELALAHRADSRYQQVPKHFKELPAPRHCARCY